MNLNFDTDDDTRTRWRTKANLDKAFLMYYCKDKGKEIKLLRTSTETVIWYVALDATSLFLPSCTIGRYFLQLEDDVVTVPHFASRVLSFAAQQERDSPEWIMLEFCGLGAIGKLFRSSLLPRLVLFTLQLHAFQPNDWIFPMFLFAQKCWLGLDYGGCHSRALSAHVRRHRPSLFQHVGRDSSLRGAVQPALDGDFEAYGPAGVATDGATGGATDRATGGATIDDMMDSIDATIDSTPNGKLSSDASKSVE